MHLQLVHNASEAPRPAPTASAWIDDNDQFVISVRCTKQKEILEIPSVRAQRRRLHNVRATTNDTAPQEKAVAVAATYEPKEHFVPQVSTREPVLFTRHESIKWLGEKRPRSEGMRRVSAKASELYERRRTARKSEKQRQWRVVDIMDLIPYYIACAQEMHDEGRLQKKAEHLARVETLKAELVGLTH